MLWRRGLDTNDLPCGLNGNFCEHGDEILGPIISSDAEDIVLSCDVV
jgi:hypothetical protein